MLLFEASGGHLKDGCMYKPRHNELHSFLQWRRQTRFIRHHGGPIMAVGLFVTCLWFVWRACESRQQLENSMPAVESSRMQEMDRTLQAAKMPKW